MPVYNVPLTTADGETFFHRVTAKNRGEAMRKAEAEGEFGAKAGIPSILTASLPGVPTMAGGDYAQQRTSGPTEGAIVPGFASSTDAAGGIVLPAFNPKAQAEAAAATSNLPSAVTDWGMFGEQFDPRGGNIDLSGDLGVVDKQAEVQQNVYGPIRPWQERVADIRVEYDPDYTGAGSKGRRLILPPDMWRFDADNTIRVEQIEAAMSKLAVLEGSGTYDGVVQQFFDQAEEHFQKGKPEMVRRWTKAGYKEMEGEDNRIVTRGRKDRTSLPTEFVNLALKDGKTAIYYSSKGKHAGEDFEDRKEEIFKLATGSRREGIEAADVTEITGAIGDKEEPWDHLPERYHNQKMYDKYQELSPEEQDVAANPNISEYYQDRPSEYLALSPNLKAHIISGHAVDAKTLEPFALQEIADTEKAEQLEFHDVVNTDPNLHGMQTFKPLDDLDADTTFAQETGEPGAVWEPIDETGFEEDKALDVGPDITLPPDAPTYQPAPPMVVPPPGGAPPPPPGGAPPGGGPPGGAPPPQGGPGDMNPNLSFEANMQGVLDNRGLFEVSPTAGYRRAFGNVFGEGFGRRGPIGGYLQGLQDPLTAAFQGGAIRNLLNPQAVDAAGAPPPGQSFQNFLQQAQGAPGGLGSAWDQALQDVNTFRGMQQADVPVAAQRYFAPQSMQDVGQAARLMGAAQRARYSPLVSGMFRPQSYEDLYGDYVLQNQDRANAGEAMPANFYDFAASRFGL